MNVEWQAILSDASAMDDASDQQLGHELEAVVRQHARFVYQVAYLLLRNHHDAEDSTQETFMRALHGASRSTAGRTPPKSRSLTPPMRYSSSTPPARARRK